MPMSRRHLNKPNNKTRFCVGMTYKVWEQTNALTDYVVRDVNTKKILGEKLAESYGIRTRNIKPEDMTLYEEIVRNLAILSIQYVNIMKYHEDASEAYNDMKFDFSHMLLKSPIDSKVLIYIKSRIEYNKRNFNLDENHYPRKIFTYNKRMFDAYLKSAVKVFAFFDTMEDFANAPTKKIVRKMKIVDKAQVGNVLLVTKSYMENNAHKLLSKRKIVLFY